MLHQKLESLKFQKESLSTISKRENEISGQIIEKQKRISQIRNSELVNPRRPSEINSEILCFSRTLPPLGLDFIFIYEQLNDQLTRLILEHSDFTRKQDFQIQKTIYLLKKTLQKRIPEIEVP